MLLYSAIGMSEERRALTRPISDKRAIDVQHHPRTLRVTP
jgi:hypothetical protein